MVRTVASAASLINLNKRMVAAGEIPPSVTSHEKGDHGGVLALRICRCCVMVEYHSVKNLNLV